MNERSVVDSDGLVACLSGADAHHVRAKEIWRHLGDSDSAVLVPKFSRIEAVKAIQQSTNPPDRGRSMAIVVGQYLRGLEDSGCIRIVNPTPVEEKRPGRFLTRLK